MTTSSTSTTTGCRSHVRPGRCRSPRSHEPREARAVTTRAPCPDRAFLVRAGSSPGSTASRACTARDSMVVTLRASHVELGQRVWVRYLLPRAARRPDALARFMKSARAVARMRSEHTARVLDMGRIRVGIPFVVLDDMNGWDLDEVLRVRGPLPVQEAVEYVLQAAEAVAEAHSLGIVHGSLRPSNLLLARREDESPLVRVVGFELSDVVDWTTPEGRHRYGPLVRLVRLDARVPWLPSRFAVSSTSTSASMSGRSARSFIRSSPVGRPSGRGQRRHCSPRWRRTSRGRSPKHAATSLPISKI